MYKAISCCKNNCYMSHGIPKEEHVPRFHNYTFVFKAISCCKNNCYMSHGIPKKEPLTFLIIPVFHLFYRPVSVYKAQGIPKKKHLAFMIIPLYKVIPCCKTNCYDILEFVYQTNFVQIYTKDNSS